MTSQSKIHAISEASGSEVKLNDTLVENPPQTTRSQFHRRILQNTPSLSEE